MVRVGTPSQDFRIFPSTVGQETLIPVPEGCIESDPSDCGSLRGVMPFDGAQGTGFLTNDSSTWISINIDTTNIEDDLGYDVNALYGFDTVGLEVENSDGLNQTHQVVGGIAAKDFYLGVFGLGPKPSNFSNFDDPQPSFMANLVNSKQIPSMSYGYTAGASYRYDKVLGSLTLGGYDSSRFTPSNVTFPFGPDDSNVLAVGIQSILGMSTLSGTVNLLSTAQFSTIDSTLPYIWLPESDCNAFATAFGLTYDNTTDLYLVNSTIHTKLLSLNPTLTFILGPSLSTGNSTQNIVLPYAAFDLLASSPFYLTPTRYFPLRRAANSTQYVLGRTFLQEAYITVDYTRSNFSVAQAIFSNPMPEEQIIAILPPSSSNGTSINGTTSILPAHHHISAGDIAAIVISATSFLLLILALTLYLLRRRRRQLNSTLLPPIPISPPPESLPLHDTKPEMPSESLIELATPPPPELDSKWGGGGGVQELHAPPGWSKAELDSGHYVWAEAEGSPGVRVHELEGSEMRGRSQSRGRML